MADYLSDVKIGLLRWVQRELNITTLFAEQFRIRPQKSPYATIRVGMVSPYGFKDEEGEVDDEGIALVDGHRNAMAVIDINGDGANELALQLHASLSKTTVLGILWNSYGVAILDRGSVTNLTELLETSGLERAVLEIRIGFAVQYEDNVGLIEHVELIAEDTEGGVISDEIIPPLD
jgi:hypothetical protein